MKAHPAAHAGPWILAGRIVRAFVLEHLGQIPTVDHVAADRALDEMVSLAPGRPADRPTRVLRRRRGLGAAAASTPRALWSCHGRGTVCAGGAANLVWDSTDSMLRYLARQAILGEALALPGHSRTQAMNGKLRRLSRFTVIGWRG
jgi:hypothetical protein